MMSPASDIASMTSACSDETTSAVSLDAVAQASADSKCILSPPSPLSVLLKTLLPASVSSVSLTSQRFLLPTLSIFSSTHVTE
uniref:Uncharacterized protein n=1 Tax=Rhizophora mucronata TaxID=61149 RepID=A0A2P2L2Q3_RHIMU